MLTMKFEKDALHTNQKEALFMVETQDTSKVEKKKESKKLNIAIALDVSGSMGMSIAGMGVLNNYGLSGLQGMSSNERASSKLEQAKVVAKNTVDNMKNGDVLSFVTFNDRVKIVIEATELSDANRDEIKSVIDRVQSGGMTDIHAGWLNAASELSKNVSKKNINRVLLLTDGEITTGIRNHQDIANDVAMISEKAISISTFGIGKDFNEDLLQLMADSGNGNSYYVENEAQMDSVFQEEFEDFSNISATDVKVEFKLNDGVEVVEQFNEFEEVLGKYKMPNIKRQNKGFGLFKLSLGGLSEGVKEISLGTLVLSYNDADGNTQKIEYPIESKVVSVSDYDKLEFNQDVKVQETLLTVAKKKKEAQKAIDVMDMDKAKKLLDDSAGLLRGSKFKDDRVTSALATTEATLLNADTMGAVALRKDMSYQSYATMRSRDL